MYTSDDLIEIAKNRGVRVTARQIGEWHRDMLLPRPTPRIAGRGRPRLDFPEPTPDVVEWLGRYRRSLGSRDDVVAWLWLEGYDYVGLDPATLQAAVEHWLRQLWTGVQREYPGLPDVDRVTSPPDNNHDDAVNQWTIASVETPLHARNRNSGVDEVAAVAMALFGVGNAWDDRDMLPFTVRAMGALDHGGGIPTDVDVSRLMGDSTPERAALPIGPALTAFNLTTRVQHPIDVRQARALWQDLTTAIDMVSAIPMLPATLQPFMTFFQTLRRRAYSLHLAGAIYALAVAASIVSPGELRRLVRDMMAPESAGECR